MAASLSPIQSLPLEMLQKIFLQVPLREIFTRLPFVCHSFNEGLTDQFFRERSFEAFPALREIPQFYDPLLQTVENPWKLICFSLSGIRINTHLRPIATRTAQTFQGQFRSHFRSHVDAYHAERSEFVKKYRSAYGHDIPNQIQLPSAPKNSGEMEQLRLEIERDGLSGIMEEATKEGQRRSLEETGDQIVGENPHAFLPLIIVNRMFKKTIDVLRERTADPRCIKFFEMMIENCTIAFDHLELVKRSAPITELDGTLSIFSRILDDQNIFKKFSASIYYHILYLIPHLKFWIPQAEKIKQLLQDIEKEQSNPDPSGARIVHIRNTINSFPQPFPGMIWSRLYDQCGNRIQQWQWAEIHFQEHLDPLNWILRSVFSEIISLLNVYKDGFNANPMKDISFAISIIDSGYISFTYPPFNPEPTRTEDLYPIQETDIDSHPRAQAIWDDIDNPVRVVSMGPEPRQHNQGNDFTDKETLELLRREFYQGSQQDRLIPVDPNVVEYLLFLFSKIQSQLAKLKAFQIVLLANNSTPDIARKFFEALPEGTPGVTEASKSTLRELIWIANGCDDEGMGLNFGHFIIRERITSPLVLEVVQALREDLERKFSD